MRRIHIISNLFVTFWGSKWIDNFYRLMQILLAYKSESPFFIMNKVGVIGRNGYLAGAFYAAIEGCMV